MQAYQYTYAHGHAFSLKMPASYTIVSFKFCISRRGRDTPHRRVQARSQDNYDPEDPWDQALEAFEAQRRQAEEDAESMRAGADGASGWTGLSNQVLLDSERKREDESPDWEFYDSPRLVYHADNDVFTRLITIGIVVGIITCFKTLLHKRRFAIRRRQTLGI